MRQLRMLFVKKSLKVYNLPMHTTIFYKDTELSGTRFYEKCQVTERNRYEKVFASNRDTFVRCSYSRLFVLALCWPFLYFRVAFLKLTGGNGITGWLQIAVIAGILLFLSQYDWFFDHFLRDERDRKYK